MSLPLSILDLTPMGAGKSSTRTVQDSVVLAQRAEAMGFRRIWYAEHHSLPGVASTSPALMIGHVATQTERIRLGAGGVMLPNHAAINVVEAYRLLEAMHPGRIDLGLGRAPGTDQPTALAIRGRERLMRNDFPQQLAELEAWARDEQPIAGVFARPADVPLPPVWLLGSSGFSAQLAAARGYPYAFASHFSPAPPDAAMLGYDEHFRPHPDRPAGKQAILAVAAFVADSEEEAEDLARPSLVAFTRLRTGRPILTPTREEARAYRFEGVEADVARAIRSMQHVGTPDQVADRIRTIALRTRADEVMVVTNAADLEGRIRSYELLAGAWGHAR